MGVHRGEKCFFLGINFQMVASVLFVAGGILAGPSRAADSDPLILFNHETDGALVYSYFDTADPGMAYPVDIARIPASEKVRTVGVFNGVLYIADESGDLTGVDLGTGEAHSLNVSLPKRYVQQDAMIYVLPGKETPNEVRMFDLRGPFTRNVPGFPPEFANLPRIAADDGLRYITYQPVPASNSQDAPASTDTRQLLCGVLDLRAPEAPAVQFIITGRRTWRMEDLRRESFGESHPDMVYLRPVEFREAIPMAWSGDGSIACIALAVDFEGMTWEGEPDGGPTLFVMDIDTRKGRALPLSGLPETEPIDLPHGDFSGQAFNGYAIDTRTMGVVKPSATSEPQGLKSLGEHFFISRQGPMKVLHGGQPLEWKRDQNVMNAEVDSSGERILIRDTKSAVCYDVHYGYYAECVPGNYHRFQERSALHRVEISPSEGWTLLLQQPIMGRPEVGAPSNRRDRAGEYTLIASPGKTAYAEGETVSIQVALTLAGTEAQWTDVPVPDFPVLSGTLASSAYAMAVSKIANLKPVQPAAPTYLEPGGVLTATLEFIPEARGTYTFALAYGGNSESEWYGLAKAPLVRFTVGDTTQNEKVRLRYAIEDFIKRRGRIEDPFFDELKAAGDEGADLLAGMLREIPMPDPLTQLPGDEDGHKHWSTVSSLYNYLSDLRSPRLIPFFKELLASKDRDLKYNGFFGIQALHKSSKDPVFRAELEAIVRDAYADDEQIWRARAEKDLGVVLFPALYEELKAQALGSDAALQREALKTMAEQYLWRLDTFSGDMERFIGMILANEQFSLSSSAMICVGQFYGRGVDHPNAQRAIDEYRLHHPEWFNGDFLDTETDLWDMAWLRRTAEEPTEARFTLLQRSFEHVEAHTGIKRAAAFPVTWSDLQSSETARAEFAATLNAWADFIQTSPAPFRIPEFKK